MTRTYSPNMRWQQNSLLIRNSLIVFVVMSMLVMSIISLILHRSKSQLEEALVTANQYALSRVRDNVDMIVREGDRIATFVSKDESICALSATDSFLYNVQAYEKIKKLTQANNTLALLSGTSQYVESIYVYYPNSKYILISDYGILHIAQYPDSKWIEDKQFELHGNQKCAALRFPTTSAVSVSPYYLSIAQSFRIATGDQGTVMVNLKINTIGREMEERGQEENRMLYITNSDGRILYAPNAEEVDRILSEKLRLSLSSQIDEVNMQIEWKGQASLVCALRSSVTGYWYYSISSMESIVRKSDAIRAFGFSILMIGIFLLLILSFALANKFYKPIRSIARLLDAPDEWVRESEKRRETPEDQLCDRIMLSITRNEKLEQELTDRMLSLRHAQEAALQSRFNPHFLYNTLDTIYWMSVRQSGGENPASEMIVLLADLMRASLTKPSQLSPLSQEIELAKKYLRINELRKPNRCQTSWRISDDVKDMLVMRMMLQPILENSWLHGFKGMTHGCTLVISAEAREDKLILAVKDNGCGIPDEIMKAIIGQMESDEFLSNAYIGLANIQRRLKLMFGTAYGLTLLSEQGNGTCVTVTLPIIKCNSE